ncbi:MAG TPA: hypothetical protein PLG87_01225 [Treponemataceae bacterium]|nr:hypothetical protein [Treponemataceae bacterium]
MENLYAPESFILMQNGRAAKTKDLLSSNDHFLPLYTHSNKDSAHIIFQCPSDNGTYEIARISAENGIQYAVLTHRLLADKPQIEYQLSALQEESGDLCGELDSLRSLFGSIISETHDVDRLIHTLYSKNPFYYNKGRLLNSQEKLISEYSYMEDKDFEIGLTKEKSYTANSSCIFEIGRWTSGAYTGTYVLMWIKEDAEWKILFDSNY